MKKIWIIFKVVCGVGEGGVIGCALFSAFSTTISKI